MMLSEAIIQQSQKLTELASQQLFNQIQLQPVTTPLVEQPILTSYVKVEGEKQPPILLIHGFDSSLLEFRRLIPNLSPHRQIWAVDLLGFGFTQRYPQLIYSPATIKTHLYHFWKTLINEPMIIVGASMGGASAIDFTLTYPDIVTKLILLDSGGLIKQPIMSKFIFPPLDYFATQFLSNLKVRQGISKNAYFNSEFAHEDALICSALHLNCDNWSRALISFTKSGGYGSFADQLDNIKQPTLIIWGKNDRILGTKYAPRFADLIPNNKLIWIEKCGHVPHLEQAKFTATHILNFLSNK